MKTFRSSIIVSLLITALTAGYVNIGHAMELFISKTPENIRVGDVTLLTVAINSDKEINVIEGSLTLSDNVSLRTVLTTSSAFRLWPQRPSLQDRTITFTGGSVEPVSGSNVELFTLALDVIREGNIEITFNDTNAFLADGEATQIVVRSNTAALAVKPADTSGKNNELAQAILSDKTPPEKFTIAIGRDDQTFDGNYFATFYTIDTDSGLNRYEVIEGDLPLVRSGSTYVLLDQSLNTRLTVKAIDNAGNERVVSLIPKHYSSSSMAWTYVISIVIVILIILISGYGIYRRRRQPKITS